MDPTTIFCPNGNCPARGQIGQGNIGIHSRKDSASLSRCRKSWRHHRHGVLSVAHLDSDRGEHRNRVRPWVSRASDRGGFWSGGADGCRLVGTLQSTGTG